VRPGRIRPDWPAPRWVAAFSTTRAGGFSEGPWRSFNLGLSCGDSTEAVRHNRSLLRDLLPAEPAWLEQVHGTSVVRHEEVAQGARADAIVADAPRRVCAVLTADCLPVLFSDVHGRRVAAAHAGWRGLAAGVLERTVEALETRPADILAWLGPGIGPSSYQVGADVRDAFVGDDAGAAAAFEPDGARWLANLYALARKRLGRAGVRRVYGGTHCTFSEPERFYSYRRDGVTGRMATVIWIKDE